MYRKLNYNIYTIKQIINEKKNNFCDHVKNWDDSFNLQNTLYNNEQIQKVWSNTTNWEIKKVTAKKLFFTIDEETTFFKIVNFYCCIEKYNQKRHTKILKPPKINPPKY